MAEKYKNAYFVGIFACCREIYIYKSHTNCFYVESGEQSVAQAHYDAIDEFEERRKKGEVSTEEEYDYLVKINERLKGYITNAEPEEYVEPEKTAPPSRGC